MKFRSYLLVTLLCAALVPGLTAAFLHHRAASEQLRQGDRQLGRSARLVAQALSDRLQSAQEFMDLAARHAAENPDETPKELSAFLSRLQKAHPVFLNLHYDSPRGFSVAFCPERTPAGVSNIGVDHRSRAHWGLIREGKAGIANVIRATGASSGLLVNVIGRAPEGASGQALHAVGALNLGVLAKEVLSIHAFPGQHVFLLDANGVPITAGDGPGKSLLAPEAVARAGSSDDGLWQQVSLDSRSLSGVLYPVKPHGWAVGVFRDDAERGRERSRILLAYGTMLLLVLFLTFLAAEIASRPLSRAVRRLSSQVSARRAAPLPAEAVDSPQELADLQRTFGEVTGSLEKARLELEGLNRNLQAEVERRVRQIKARETTLSAVFSGMVDGVVLSGATGRVTFANGRAREFIPGIAEGMEILPLLEQSFRSDRSPTVWLAGNPVRLRSKEGALMLDLQTFPVDDDRSQLGILLHDASVADTIARMKDDLIGVAAHELKTPLAGLKLQADYLKLASPSLKPDEIAEVSEGLSAEADRLKQLVDNWLDVARMDSGAFRIEPRVFQLKPLLRKAAGIARGAGDFRLSVRVEEAAECLMADPDAMLQVFVNLFTNAVRYAREGVPPEVTVTARPEGGKIRIDVADNGQGIAPENCRKVFDRFFQADMSARRRSGGTGLGLVIVEGIVKLHSGEIRAAGTPGSGSVFTITLPA